MSASSGCGGGVFLRSELPVEWFGVYDDVGAERARKARFLLRRRDPEFLEVIQSAAAHADGPVAPPPAVLPVSLRRSRRVLGLEAEFEGLAPAARRCRVK